MSVGNGLEDAATAGTGTAAGRAGIGTYVLFRVGTTPYALPVDAVHHVLPLVHVTRVPTDAPHVLGLFHHLGRVMALWALHALYGIPEDPPARPVILVVGLGERRFGFLVSVVEEVAFASVETPAGLDALAAPAHLRRAIAGIVHGVAREDDGPNGLPSGAPGDASMAARVLERPPARAPLGPRIASAPRVPIRAASSRRTAPSADDGPRRLGLLIDLATFVAIGTGESVREDPS